MSFSETKVSSVLVMGFFIGTIIQSNFLMTIIKKYEECCLTVQSLLFDCLYGGRI